jgi:protein ImuB
MKRYASIWFPFLLAEHAARKSPELKDQPFVLASSQRGRMVVDGVNPLAMEKGIRPGMVLADCRALYPELHMVRTPADGSRKLLHALAEWSIRYTPICSVDPPDGLILDTTGCPHLWGGEETYLKNIVAKLGGYGYTVKIALSDTIGTAWGMARFSNQSIVSRGGHAKVLRDLPPAALRLDETILMRLKKLGFRQIGYFMDMPRPVLRRRFGPELLKRLGQALGHEPEFIEPVNPAPPYQERISCLEPITTSAGITIALNELLDKLCARLADEGLGLRKAIFSAYRLDGNIQKIETGASYPTRSQSHIFKLFKEKISSLRPDLGFELFVLDAPQIEPVTPEQAALWEKLSHDKLKIGELLDRIAIKTSPDSVKRYLPAQHHWPERSVQEAAPLWQKPECDWPIHLPRPVYLLPKPEPIEVTAVVPDYPPLHFKYRRNLYHVARSEGPERIEQEWWLTDGIARDYYCVEDQAGARFWIFRSGRYDEDTPKWFIHGFFA